MKKLKLQNESFIYLEDDFKEWLGTLGYAKETAITFPIHVREFLHYLETKQKIQSIKNVRSQHVESFINYLEQRPNEKTGGGLSIASINKCLQAVHTFAKYLRQNGRLELVLLPKKLRLEEKERQILTPLEIKALHQATYTPERENARAMGQRDRAILAVFYGAGLRKNEGFRLNVEDIQLEKGLIHVKHGKLGKNRLVPIARKHKEDLEDYINEGREWFTVDHSITYYTNRRKATIASDALFLNQKGQRMKYGYYGRLTKLKQRTKIKKPIGLHLLRHSIATHLLAAGMPVEEIRAFLGHSSLVSTQIYTHIVNNYENIHELVEAE